MGCVGLGGWLAGCAGSGVTPEGAPLDQATGRYTQKEPPGPAPALGEGKDWTIAEPGEPIGSPELVVTPEPTPESTPVSTPEPTPIPTPTPPPVPTPRPTPEPTPKPEPIQIFANEGAIKARLGREAYFKQGFPRIKVTAVDESAQDPAFQTFFTALKAAVAARDMDALMPLIDPKRIISAPDKPAGMNTFVTQWNLTYDPRRSGLWERLGDALAMGVARHGDVFESPGFAYVSPLAEGLLDEQIDPEDRAIVTGKQVRLRSTPGLQGEELDQLTWEIVKVAEVPPARDESLNGSKLYPWWEVVTYSGQRGYIYGKLLHAAVDDTARFEQIDGEWKLVRFSKGR